MGQISLLLPLADGADELMEHVLPHYFGRVHGQHPEPFALSNHILLIGLAALLVVITFMYVAARSRATMVPTGLHNFFEAILSFFRTDVVRPALGANADRFIPFIWTVFFFILYCNLLGMLPVNEVITVITGKPAHIWGTATANFMLTAGLAVIAFVAIHVSGIIQAVRVQMDPSLAPHHSGTDHSEPHGHGPMHGMQGIEDERDVVIDHKPGDGHDHAHGLHYSKEFHGKPFPKAVVWGIGGYMWNFAPHPDMGNKVLDLLMFGFLLLLEVFGAIIKPFSLAIRLFANMLAGHLVLAALIMMIPFGMHWAATGSISFVVIAGCAALSCLELFVAFLQAYIFAFLTTLFIASAVAPEH